MKKSKLLSLTMLLALSVMLFSSCRQMVPAGYVGVKTYLLGTTKGVDHEVLGVGKYYIGYNEQLDLFPTFQINYTFTKSPTEGSPENEEFTFQTKEGMECSVDLGVALHFNINKISTMYQTYRKGVDEIRSVVVRNTIRDVLNKKSSNLPVESVYGEGKAILIENVQNVVKSTLDSSGIVIDKIYLIGSIRIPDKVKAALDSKVEMTQDAQKAENEVKKAEAEAKIKIAKANGDAQSVIINAQAQAKANQLLSASLTQTLVNYNAVDKWDGKLPQVSGGNTPFINISK
jgi:regulator of protease activity HflC (stomatin/prohibitin superfamily)